jgi:hypothetical protein
MPCDVCVALAASPVGKIPGITSRHQNKAGKPEYIVSLASGFSQNLGRHERREYLSIEELIAQTGAELSTQPFSCWLPRVM